MSMPSTTGDAIEPAGGEGVPSLDPLRDIVGELERLALEQEGRKRQIEERWLQDLRQYHGRYDEDTEANLKDTPRSKLFVTMTRAKTNTFAARLGDMLLPTDDKNWGIRPSPVPESLEKPVEPQRQPQAMPGGMPGQQPPTAAPQAAVTPLRPGQEPFGEQEAPPGEPMRPAGFDDVDKRAEAMEAEIDDQLRTSRYYELTREALEDACKLGTGISKGPMVKGRAKRSWQKGEDGTYQMIWSDDPLPSWSRVDPWHFFPDMSARRPEDRRFDFERHLYTKRDLRRMAREGNYDKAGLRRLVEEGPSDLKPDYIDHLREITQAGNEGTAIGDELYVCWEYHGPLEPEQYRTICECLDPGRLPEEETEDGGQTEDPLEVRHVTITFCQGEVLRFSEHHLDSQESIYSVFALERDEASVFGFGVPYLMRNSQKALNAGWRGMLDNAGLSVGPIVVFDDRFVEPEDGSPEITGRKVYRFKGGQAGGLGVRDVFHIFNIPSNQGDLAGIIELSKQFIDDETMTPLIAQGEQDTNITKTFQGMALLQQSANIVLRRVVKNFDDCYTQPNLRRAYDWNMQFNKREEIKGDFEVDARGVSVLLVREIQANNLMIFALQFAAHPIFGPMLKPYELFKSLVQANAVPVEEVVKTQEDWEADMAEAEQNGQPSPEEIKAQTQFKIAQMSAEVEVNLAQQKNQLAMVLERAKQETALIQAAQTQNMKMADIEAMLAKHRMQIDSTERLAAADLGAAERRDRRQAETSEPQSQSVLSRA